METLSTGGGRAAIRAAALAFAAWAAATLPASGQRLLDLEPRIAAGSEAVLGGATAVFWNPAAIGMLERTAEATVIDVRAPRSTGLGGMAAAAAMRIARRTTVSVGFQHVGIDDIERTTGSPLPGQGEGTFDLSENVLSGAVSHAFREHVIVGVGAHYTRAADLAGVDDAVEVAAGVDVRPRLPLAPRVGFASRLRGGELGWIGGVEIAPYRDASGEWAVLASYGVASGLRRGTGHRVAAGARWADRIGVTAGLTGEPDGDGTSWTPIASADLQISRYVVGLLREAMPNDFGAVYALRFTVQF